MAQPWRNVTSTYMWQHRHGYFPSPNHTSPPRYCDLEGVTHNRDFESSTVDVHSRFVHNAEWFQWDPAVMALTPL